MGMISSRMNACWRHALRRRGSMILVLASSLSSRRDTMSHAAATNRDEPRPGNARSVPHRPPRGPARAGAAGQCDALRRPGEPDGRPGLGLSVRGLEPGPGQGLFLRSFTQLTAIGQYMELLANVAAGTLRDALSHPEAGSGDLTRLVKSLRQDQRDPTLSARACWATSWTWPPASGSAPWPSDVEKHKLLGRLRPGRRARRSGRRSRPRGGSSRGTRTARPTSSGPPSTAGTISTAPWPPSATTATKQKIMDILDQRVVMIVFIDNANLSSRPRRRSARSCTRRSRTSPGSRELRQELEQFLDAQREGYAQLYDAKAGQFYFGRDATKDRHFGWVDLEGKWVTGHVDYLVNEFRGPATFVVTRFGLPIDAIKNLGFKMKPYRLQDGRGRLRPGPLGRLGVPGPGARAVDDRAGPAELAQAAGERRRRRDRLRHAHKLPGFLSESYSGEGVQYTGSVGIPDITVSPLPRITDAASLYTLGAAYTVAPDKIERFLAANWPAVSRLLTEHGPWEGLKGRQTGGDPVPDDRPHLVADPGSARHGVGSYESLHGFQGPRRRLDEIFRPGGDVDFLAERDPGLRLERQGHPIQSRARAGGLSRRGPTDQRGRDRLRAEQPPRE